MIPGEYRTVQGTVELNAGRKNGDDPCGQYGRQAGAGRLAFSFFLKSTGV